MVDTQIKRAKLDAEQNFKIEMARMKKDVQSVSVLTDQQGKVISALSKDLGGVSAEIQRMNAMISGMQAQLLSQRQITSATQVALDQGMKQLVDMDKRLMSVGAPPSSGMMNAFVGGLTQAAETHQQILEHHMMAREAQGGKQGRARKGKKDGKTLRAEAPEFIPADMSGAPEMVAPADEEE
jgi:septation ring formation regulator EzrA